MLHQAHEGGVRKTFGEFYRLNALPVKVGLSARHQWCPHDNCLQMIERQK